MIPERCTKNTSARHSHSARRVAARNRRVACAPRARSDFGRAVSRILSVPKTGERIICLSSQYPRPVPLSQDLEQATPGPPIWPCSRWGFPCLLDYSWSGGLLPRLFTLTADTQVTAAVYFLWHFPSKSLSTFLPRVSSYSRLAPARQSYAASRLMEFGLSSPGLNPERFSALPKSAEDYRQKEVLQANLRAANLRGSSRPDPEQKWVRNAALPEKARDIRTGAPRGRRGIRELRLAARG